MIEEAIVRRSAQTTRQRILDVAVQRFSRGSYAETTLRDIAADVGCDVALVHRAFGSKDELFRQAVKSTIDGDFAEAVQSADPSLSLTSRFVRSRLDPAVIKIDPLDIVVHSLNCERANPILREVALQDVVRPLALRLPHNGEFRAAAAIACLTGLALLRDVLGIPALRDADLEDMQQIVAAVMSACLGMDILPPST